MKRRETILALLALGATPLAAKAQRTGRMYRIGVLSTPTLPAANIEAIRQGLREHGYIEGRNLRIEWRIADGNVDKLPKFAAELVGMMQADPLFYSYRTQIMDYATKAHLPVLGWNRQLAESGALISYGANNISICRRAGFFIDKILKGAKPRDLPVEQPSEFEFVVNLTTAKALGISIPQSLLARADQVIQ